MKVALVTGGKIVQNRDEMPAFDQQSNEIRSDKPGSAERSHFVAFGKCI